MRTKRIVVILMILGTIGILGTEPGQAKAAEEKTFLDRLDDFGRSIFDGIIPPKKSKAKTQETAAKDQRPSSRWQDLSEQTDEAAAPRAGSVLDRNTQRAPDSRKPAETKPNSEYDAESMPPVYVRGEDGRPKQVRRPAAAKSLWDDEEPAAKPARKIPAEPPRKATSAPADLYGDLPALSDPGKPKAKPLYKRMEGFRQSVFSSEQMPEERPQADLPPQRSAELKPIEAAVEAVPETPGKTPRPLIAQRETPEPRSGGAAPLEPLSIDQQAPAGQVDNQPMNPSAGQVDNLSSKPSVGQVDNLSNKNQSGVLFSRKSPNLSVETFGPRTISVGRESTYEVHVINSGNVAAEGLVVYVSLPEWAEIAAAEASAGAAQAAEINKKDGTVRWNVGSLSAKGRERLTLKIVPRQSRPFDLSVRWDYKPVASQASIEVQEPKLVMQLDGPHEVFYGKKELFQLHLANTGTGNAENVVLTLMPIGTGENVQATHKIGVLAAGEKKTLEVELTARQAGKLSIQLDVRADGNLHAELAEKVLVRRAGLKIDFAGPKIQFVDTVGNYAISILNPGNAPARNVKFELALPPGAKYLSGIDGARLNASGDKLTWTLDSLDPQKERHFALKCSMGTTGLCRLRLTAAGDDDLTAQAETVVQVDAVADLTMDVKDPAGPIPIGEEVVYEVRVRNRGTKEARNVEVFAYFSRGIEPISADGGESRLGPGQVVFQPIAALAPNAEKVFKIHARAATAGNLVFRAETHCKPVNARLISEATNLYYGDAATAPQTAREPSAAAPTQK